MNTKVDFDDYAKKYRELHSENLKITGEDSEYFTEYKIKEIQRFFNTDEPLKILDFGCGDGVSELYFEKYFSRATIYGLDISKESILKAKESKTQRSQFNCFNGLDIPYEDNSFDLVYSACVFHHIEATQHGNILKEIYRVLKKGGKLIIFEHNPINPFTKRIVKDCLFDKDAVLIKPKQIRKNIKDTGFTNTRVLYTLFMPRLSFFKPFLFIEKYLSNLSIGGQYYILTQK